MEGCVYSGCKADLRGLYTYIAEELCAPEAAAGQAGRIMEEIENKVYVIRIMYGGRDVQRQLADTKMEY